jgi:pimeloyl-ACP methyl ester carboxylesterase
MLHERFRDGPPAVAIADLFAVLTALEIAPTMFLGTSYGLLAMMLGAAWRPTSITGVIINNIGLRHRAAGLGADQVLRGKSCAGGSTRSPQACTAGLARVCPAHLARARPPTGADYDLKLARTWWSGLPQDPSPSKFLKRTCRCMGDGDAVFGLRGFDGRAPRRQHDD